MRNEIPFPHGRNFYIQITIVAITIVAAMAYSFYSSNRMITKYGPLIDATMEVKLEATRAHLSFEEIILDDRSGNIDDIINHLDLAEWYAKAMLEGGENPEGTFLPLSNPLLRGEVEMVLNKLNKFKATTIKKYQAVSDAEIGSETHQEYDRLFQNFIDQIDNVETKLQQKIKVDIKRHKSVQLSLIAAIILLTLLAVFLQYNYNSIRKQAEKERERLIYELQKSLEEVKTLRGIIPICMYCHKIKAELGDWNKLEIYIEEHSTADFTHGICPDCLKKQLEEVKKIKGD